MPDLPDEAADEAEEKAKDAGKPKTDPSPNVGTGDPPDCPEGEEDCEEN